MKLPVVISLITLATCSPLAMAAPTHPVKPVSPNFGKPAPPAKYKTLIEAVQAQDLPAVRFLLHHGSDPDETDGADKTALMYAAASGNLAIAKTLLASGADVDRCDDGGHTTVSWATQPAMINLIQRHRPAPIYLPGPVSHETFIVNGDSLETEDVLKTKYVEGYITNNTQKTFDYVSVDIVFFDDAGIQVDSGTDITQHLAPGKMWRFKVSSYRDGVARYKIVKVKGD